VRGGRRLRHPAAAVAAAAAAAESGKAPVAPARVNAAVEAVYMSALTVSPRFGGLSV